MNIFYEDFPAALMINNEEYPIITDFREWIRFSDMIKSEIPSQIKYKFMSEMFLDSIPEFTEDTISLIFEAIKKFLAMSEIQIPDQYSLNSALKTNKATISYEYDAPYIISAFLQNYGIDLIEIEYMHWWKFKMLLDGLPEECQIKQRIYYRSIDLSSIKDKVERKRIAKIQRQIALPGNEYVSDGEIGNAF